MTTAQGATNSMKPLLEGHWGYLRPTLDEDAPSLYELAVSPESAMRSRYIGIIPSYEQFINELWLAVLVQFTLVDSSGKIAGNAVCYSADLRNRHANVAVFVADRYFGSPLESDMSALFYGNLFRTWDLRKLYCRAPAYVSPEGGGGLLSEFAREAYLDSHQYLQGRYWALEIWALTEESWRRACESVQQRVFDPLLASDITQLRSPGAFAGCVRRPTHAPLSRLEALAILRAFATHGLDVAAICVADLRTLSDASDVLVTLLDGGGEMS